jgi:hemerythrin
MQWNDSFSLGNVVLDTQHKKLISLFADFSKSVMRNHKSESLLWEFEEIIEFASVHFKTEEQIFDLSDYPEAQQHKEEHRDIIKTLETYKPKFQGDLSFLQEELIPFLGEWIHNHIQITDRGYAQYI